MASFLQSGFPSPCWRREGDVEKAAQVGALVAAVIQRKGAGLGSGRRSQRVELQGYETAIRDFHMLRSSRRRGAGFIC